MVSFVLVLRFINNVANPKIPCLKLIFALMQTI